MKMVKVAVKKRNSKTVAVCSGKFFLEKMLLRRARNRYIFIFEVEKRQVASVVKVFLLSFVL